MIVDSQSKMYWSKEIDDFRVERIYSKAEAKCRREGGQISSYFAATKRDADAKTANFERESSAAFCPSKNRERILLARKNVSS